MPGCFGVKSSPETTTTMASLTGWTTIGTPDGLSNAAELLISDVAPFDHDNDGDRDDPRRTTTKTA